MQINKENYFSQEAQKEYFSASQVKAFMDCENRAMAEILGDFVPEPSQSMLVGSYVDAYIFNEFEDFCIKHPEIFKKDGSAKAEYLHANVIINKLRNDPVMSRYLSGLPQVILTAEMFGHPFKIKMDSYFPGKAIVDLKVMKDFEPIYVEGMGRVSFIEAWHYDIQGAIYQKVEQIAMGRPEPLPFFLACATKQKVPDIELIRIPQYKLDAALKIVEAEIDRFADIKAGLIEPVRCEKCDYCRETKVLTGPIVWEEVVDE